MAKKGSVKKVVIIVVLAMIFITAGFFIYSTLYRNTNSQDVKPATSSPTEATEVKVEQDFKANSVSTE